MEGKVFGIGFQKTGTSTLREALKILGFKVKDACPRALIPILKKDYNKVLQILEGFDAAEDTPWYKIYKELDQHIPNSKFILTLRDEDSWFKSVNKHIGNLRIPMHEWLYGRGKGLPSDDPENTRKVYSDHNREVLEYFKDRPEDLLVLDFTQGDSWEKICNFLNKEIPDVSFPHYNSTAKSVAKAQNKKPGLGKRLNMKKKQIKGQLQIKYIDWRGLW